MKRFHLALVALLVPLDALALFTGFALAYYIRGQYVLFSPDGLTPIAAKLQYHATANLLPFANYVHYLAFIIPMMLVVFALFGLYAIRSRAGWWARTVRVVIGVSVGEFGILVLFLLKKNFFLPRTTVVYSWILCIALVLLVRAVIRGIEVAMYRQGRGRIRIAILGKNAPAERVATHLAANVAYELHGHYADGMMEGVLKELDTEQLDELIVVSQHYSNEELTRLRNHCLEHRVNFSFVPPLLTELQSVFEVRTLAGLPAIEVRPTPLEGWGRIVKRGFDILASLFFLIILSPIFLLIALWLKLVSPGPLIYKHRRIGRDKLPIDVWKFRSMDWQYCTGNPQGDAAFKQLLTDNPDMAQQWLELHKLKDDPRISRPGRFLRKSSLDELPQFFNVLSGSLSLVGPRAIVTEEVAKYGERADLLFTVRPGLTGLWQVSGRNDISFNERVTLQLRYIEQWSLWSDIVIVAKTGLVIIDDVATTLTRRRAKGGAY